MFMEQAFTQGTWEEKMEGKERELAWLIWFTQESGFTFHGLNNWPPSPKSSANVGACLFYEKYAVWSVAS